MEQMFYRQELFAHWGPEGQKRIEGMRPLVAGVGGLGSHIASYLVRMGVSSLRVVDSDKVDISNIHRVALYHEADTLVASDKTAIAQERLQAIREDIAVEAIQARITAANIAHLTAGCNIVFDALDNIQTRHVINDHCFRVKLPWVYGGVLASQGMVLPVLPGEGPCFACVFKPEANDSAIPSTSTIGILPTLPPLVASLQVLEAQKMVFGYYREHPVSLKTMDIWNWDVHQLQLKRDPNCAVCGQKI